MIPTFLASLLRGGYILTGLCLSLTADGQGTFRFFNPGAPTLLYNGQTAGPGIWGQALVGLTNDSLTPLGLPAQHRTNGIIYPQSIGVPFAPDYTYVEVQMAVWDGTIWGTDFANVPASQLGFTDIVPVLVISVWAPNEHSRFFTQSAIVPLVPEPTVVALALAGAGALCLRTRRRERSRRTPIHEPDAK
jgi:hypothetical protein